jgi:hypothetical protein
VWLRHARVEFQHDACDFNMNQLNLTLDYQNFSDWVLTMDGRRSLLIPVCLWLYHTLQCDFHIMHVMLEPCVWFWHPELDFGTLLVFWTIIHVIFTLMHVIWILMPVILTCFVLNYFITIYTQTFAAGTCLGPLKNYHPHACQINTLRGIVTVPYFVLF